MGPTPSSDLTTIKLIENCNRLLTGSRGANNNKLPILTVKFSKVSLKVQSFQLQNRCFRSTAAEGTGLLFGAEATAVAEAPLGWGGGGGTFDEERSLCIVSSLSESSSRYENISTT
uniref:Uncharacterized protein n=1 Tax=Vespula pensylvanica TaxID=30213 RepID=A0A834P8J8_VESPE|nr:hypothetical protein H0235_005125 [Vespula pensylvanica]